MLCRASFILPAICSHSKLYDLCDISWLEPSDLSSGINY